MSNTQEAVREAAEAVHVAQQRYEEAVTRYVTELVREMWPTATRLDLYRPDDSEMVRIAKVFDAAGNVIGDEDSDDEDLSTDDATVIEDWLTNLHDTTGDEPGEYTLSPLETTR